MVRLKKTATLAEEYVQDYIHRRVPSNGRRSKLKMSNTNDQMTRKLPGGTPQMSRNQKRMFDYNVKKYNATPIPANWSDDVEPTGRTGPPKPKNNARQTRRTGKVILPILRKDPSKFVIQQRLLKE